MAAAIDAKNIVKKYGKNTVLDDVSLTINEGEFVCLLGPSGCGKSTFLRLVAGLDKATSGQIFLNGKDASNLVPAKRDFGIVFQSYALFPNLTAFDNVAYGLVNRKIEKGKIIELVNRYFDMVGLSDKKNRYPSQLSGGEQQRVALARALVTSPKFLLLDEPLSALDAKVRLKLRKEICAIQRELNLTTIMVTHDQDEALTMADRIVVMNRAEIMQSGSPQEIYEKPNSKFVANFIGAINFFEDESDSSKTLAIRPEHIAVSSQKTSTSRTAKINSSEFRGNFVRLSCSLTNIMKSADFMVDVPLEKIRNANLSDGSNVYLDFPKQHILSFSE